MRPEPTINETISGPTFHYGSSGRHDKDLVLTMVDRFRNLFYLSIVLLCLCTFEVSSMMPEYDIAAVTGVIIIMPALHRRS